MTCHGWLTIAGLLLVLMLPTQSCAEGMGEDEFSIMTLIHPAAVGRDIRRLPEVPSNGDQNPMPDRQSSGTLPRPAAEKRPFTQPTPLDANSRTLELTHVVRAVVTMYPLLNSVRLERQIAEGRQLSAWGAFDLGVKAYTISAPEGFYETYRNQVVLQQPTMGGGYLYGGYKIGDGNFQPWFGERETNEGGEFSAGFGVPLLKDRTIDKRREELIKSGLSRQAVEPVVQGQMLEFVQVASRLYWSWVAAGQSVVAQRELLRLAEARVKQIKERVDAGDLAKITRINNEQLIAARETKVIESERKLQEAAIKLSLFLRSADGNPIVPLESQLPRSFPKPLNLDRQQLAADISRAVAARPELVELRLIAEQVRVELAQAQNMLLPKLDAQLLASKDVGAAASSKRDKTPFELEVGLYGEVPLQRREARGKVASSQAKLSQIDVKRRFVVDKVTAAVQDAFSAIEAASGRIDRATVNQRLASETLALGREQFAAGDIDLISLNIYEQSVTDAQLLLIAAQADFFAAVADYRAVLSLGPEI